MGAALHVGAVRGLRELQDLIGELPLLIEVLERGDRVIVHEAGELALGLGCAVAAGWMVALLDIPFVLKPADCFGLAKPFVGLQEVE